ncbi:unnamed protein product [Coregonus sp. 'balchen']|nr:unnamed protein product [Coregonus sp. 'balchen']
MATEYMSGVAMLLKWLPVALWEGDVDKPLQGSVAELTPVSPCPSGPSSKRKSTDSSHLHIRVPKSLPLRRSESFPLKLLLAHWTDGGGADRCTLSPYMLRLSGAGFTYYAPGPETFV